MPIIDVEHSSFIDLTMDDSTTALAHVVCYTMNSPPTTVVWKRDGKIIDVGADEFATLQIVVDHRNSHYRNVLVITDVFDIMGNITYTCEIENMIGSTDYSITIDITGNIGVCI